MAQSPVLLVATLPPCSPECILTATLLTPVDFDRANTIVIIISATATIGGSRSAGAKPHYTVAELHHDGCLHKPIRGSGSRRQAEQADSRQPTVIVQHTSLLMS